MLCPLICTFDESYMNTDFHLFHILYVSRLTLTNQPLKYYLYKKKKKKSVCTLLVVPHEYILD